MKKLRVFAYIAALFIVSLTVACNSDSQTQIPTPTPSPVPTATPEPTPIDDSDAQDAVTSDRPKLDGVDALDALLFLEKNDPVPLGQWVCIINKNHTNQEYEPFYVRIIGVDRSLVSVNAALDDYTGVYDFTLTDEQQEFVEYGIMEYEIFYPPDYAASDVGITVLSLSWNAEPTDGTVFKSSDGTTWAGVGSTYNLHIDTSEAYPGETVTQMCIFPILKECDEGEYVFALKWHEGEPELENARETYFAAK